MHCLYGGYNLHRFSDALGLVRLDFYNNCAEYVRASPVCCVGLSEHSAPPTTPLRENTPGSAASSSKKVRIIEEPQEGSLTSRNLPATSPLPPIIKENTGKIIIKYPGLEDLTASYHNLTHSSTWHKMEHRRLSHDWLSSATLVYFREYTIPY